MDNFVVHFLAGDQVNPVFHLVGLSYLQESVPGVYVLALDPPVGQKAAQKHIYAVHVVKSHSEQGQALTTLVGK